MERVSVQTKFQPGTKLPARFLKPGWNLSPDKRAEKPHVIAFSISTQAESELTDAQWWFSTKENDGHDDFLV